MQRRAGTQRLDHVDRVVAQWAAERPDVDASAIRIVGRLSRLSRAIDRRLKAVFNANGLEAWEYDLLASLRRLGSPYELTAGEITASLMITSGAVTNRIDRLEARGFVERVKVDGDQRFVRVRLTAAGRDVMNQTLPAHLANEERLLAGLTPSERRQLERLLRKLQEGVGSD